MRTIVLQLIRWYQNRGGSRVIFGVECNFEPSCSEYTRQAIVAFGLLPGLRFGWRRIRRCTDRDCVSKLHDPVPSRMAARD